VRQHLIIVMMGSGRCSGMRVNDIAASTNLSRPAVSHHLQILKDAGIVKVRKEGTKNYYYFDADGEALDDLINMLGHARSIMAALPDRGGDD
jgi:DNA-binding transcriptional ArsR family regulator